MTAADHHPLLPGDAHDEALTSHVHPPDWPAPRPADRYNLVVVGGGTAGLVAAMGAAGLGARVALVESSLLGGDCLNYGCVPSKAVIRSGRVAAMLREAPAFGVHPGDVRVDAAAALDRMRRLRATIAPHDGAARLRDAGVDVFFGRGAFTSGEAVSVGDLHLRFARAVIATGAKAWVPPIDGLADLAPATNETLFNRTDAPRHLLVIGAGPIGCELAQTFRRLGSEVTVLSMGPVLENDDPDAAAVVARQLAADGVVLHTGVTITGAEAPAAGAKALRFRRGPDGPDETVVGDEILAATGRRANTAGLGLDAAGVEAGPRGVVVDDFLRTSNPRIFAAGDVIGQWQFTHTADAMARIVLRNALFPLGRARVSDLVVPWCTFTDPELGHVGVTSQEAQDLGLRGLTVPFDGLDRSILDGETAGFARLHLDAKGRIRGGTVVGAHAGSLLGELCVAVRHGLTAADLADTIHAYPSTPEVFKRLGDQWQRSRLTPRVARLLGALLRWQR